jgi:tetratricopeptide (TPR) repeat protein
LSEDFTPGKPSPENSGGGSSSARELAESHYYIALDLVAEGHDEQAIAEFRRSFAADPSFTDALHGLSRSLQNLNRFDEAIEVSKQIADLDPNDVLAHTGLSILYQKKGMIPEAEAEANRARILGWKQQLKQNTG